LLNVPRFQFLQTTSRLLRMHSYECFENLGGDRGRCRRRSRAGKLDLGHLQVLQYPSDCQFHTANRCFLTRIRRLLEGSSCSHVTDYNIPGRIFLPIHLSVSFPYHSF
ncbi:hypothetical protein PENTCL1PPCAC_15560, partial [Pristionchus entomophagus]